MIKLNMNQFTDWYIEKASILQKHLMATIEIMLWSLYAYQLQWKIEEVDIQGQIGYRGRCVRQYDVTSWHILATSPEPNPPVEYSDWNLDLLNFESLMTSCNIKQKKPHRTAKESGWQLHFSDYLQLPEHLVILYLSPSHLIYNQNTRCHMKHVKTPRMALIQKLSTVFNDINHSNNHWHGHTFGHTFTRGGSIVKINVALLKSKHFKKSVQIDSRVKDRENRCKPLALELAAISASNCACTSNNNFVMCLWHL